MHTGAHAHSAAPLCPNPLTFSCFRSHLPAAEIPPPSLRMLRHGKLEGAGKHRQLGRLLADLVCFSWKAGVNILAEEKKTTEGCIFKSKHNQRSSCRTLVSCREKQAIASVCVFVKIPERVFSPGKSSVK